MVPLKGVNFIAFDKGFLMTVSIICWSASMVMSFNARLCICIRFESALTFNRSITRWINGFNWQLSIDILKLPDWARAQSSKLFNKVLLWLAECNMSWLNSSISDRSLSFIWFRNNSEKPIMALNGLLKSCAIIDKNLSLVVLAIFSSFSEFLKTSSCLLRSVISRMEITLRSTLSMV